MPNQIHEDEPMFVISVAARLVNMHPQTLRSYERAGLINPTRSRGRIRLYSQRDIERLRKIARLTDELGVNLAGVEVILRLIESLETAQRELEKNQRRLESDHTIANAILAAEAAGRVSEPVSSDSRAKTPAKRTRRMR